MYKWNFIRKNEQLPTDEERLFVNWVNLDYEEAFFGIDIVETEHFDWQEYRENYGRTIYAWSSIMEQAIILPDEVVDDESLFKYLSDAGLSEICAITSTGIESQKSAIPNVRLLLPSSQDIRKTADYKYQDGERSIAFQMGAQWMKFQALTQEQ